MEAVILWGGFIGGWLLFAGPIYQAAVELREESIGENIRSIGESLPQPKPVSAWWWLLPPVHVLLSRQRSSENRKAVFASMTVEQRAQFVGFANKATGWLTVAGGAVLIAIKETWELGEHYEWPTAVFWVLIVVMFIVSVGNTAARMSRGTAMIEASPGSASEPDASSPDASN